MFEQRNVMGRHSNEKNKWINAYGALTFVTLLTEFIYDNL